MCAVLLVAVVLGGLARGVEAHGSMQRAADLGALAAATAMRDARPRLFDRARGLSVAAYTALARDTATDVARRNGAERVAVTFPDGDPVAPTRVVVTAARTVTAGGETTTVEARAEAELVPAIPAVRTGDEYPGPFAHRQGKPMRPDVALAFDRMAAAARRDGITLVITSAFRSNAEQADLFARNPDPRWVAPPGTSLHRLGTELDLGPPSAYRWLAANAERFGFVQRYSWEPWHYGYSRSAGTRSVGYGPAAGERALPAFVPERYAPAILRAAQRWSVGAALLAAQLQVESGFDPHAVSRAGARGIAQFMPATARAYDLRDPFDPDAAIDAQAHLMHDLLRRFGSVPLALAAYNAGPKPVQACGCVPPYPETQAYVARILAILDGRPDPGGGLDVRLVR